MNASKGMVLLSGGKDSAVVLDIACSQLEEVVALHIDYGQQTEPTEFENSVNLAGEYSVELHRRSDLKLRGGTTEDKEYDADQQTDKYGQSVGYVPMRNLTLLTWAAQEAESIWEQETIALCHGAQRGDYDDYADCRPDFFRYAEKAINASSDKNEFSINTPLLRLPVEEVICKAQRRDVPLKYTFSCYNSVNEKACGECPACQERQKAFEDAQVKDPVTYREE